MFSKKATRIRLADFTSPPMRAFHMAWLAFFLCFFSWFGVAPLMPVIREELHLTKAQTGNSIIASVALAVFGRLLMGWLCDRIGPRKTHAGLLILGSLPVMLIGLSHDYASFLAFRLTIGIIGASFVVTQYHTSVMFAPNIVGTANAAAAGWGNLGGGVTQMTMPLLFAAFVSLGTGAWWGWRLAMFVPGFAMLVCGVAYYAFTQDTPEGDYRGLPAGLGSRRASSGRISEAFRDPRVWALFVIYACCFGMELTIDNIAALYFADYFHLALAAAGFVAASFGMMNLFARALGGIVSDRWNRKWGLKGRVALLGCTLCCEGLGLMLFSRMRVLPFAIASMMLAGLFVKMSNGATYSIVPFVNRRVLGGVAGIVGAGGNVGAVLAGFLFKSSSLSWPQALLMLGAIVTVCSSLTILVRFTHADEQAAREEIAARLAAAPMAAASAATGD
ncbi:MAG TPA: MFS transporter [Bryobacteraceae bacterium]|nr:MFS transporter [Bryobacteraceae bacterium]